MTKESGTVPIEKIREIDKRSNDIKKKTNEKPLKVDISMDELAKLFLRTKIKYVIEEEA